MTLITVDTKLMPILPLMLRPESQKGLVIAFGMGTAFRSSLTAGIKTDAVELVPSVPGHVQVVLLRRRPRCSRTRTATSSSPTAGTTWS